ncbi:FAD-binding domain-containing protein [Actimicrobium sp. CCI2.3]|uniref:FAD-binding domain-containing protein n=1 Tax=Actimicrobium sp. CCI2.3 TaxID=3048616 RepID=UPI002AB57FB1|nr:FAD-binding domain-containing protein [Actimicrobium sp. CCI2.3]MDY7575146.1 FAD-binding domain-containing protein [Actimicrobium sp. CCI2.3]MEB0023601.1 FAD-binding domain-containing protein [Actimicrobium sp. CCI2.3]
MEIVWFKHDLRIRDHAPLTDAAATGPVLALFLHEPDIILAPDFSASHGAFIRECLDSLNAALQERGAELVEMTGSATEVFEKIWQQQPFATLWSHEETGNWVSYQRDKQVAAWCRQRGVLWRQYPQNGVLRGLTSRTKRDWLAELEAYSSSEPVKAPRNIVPSRLDPMLAEPVTPLQGAGHDKPGRIKGGRAEAIRLLTEFVRTKIIRYPQSISSPLTAEHGCSRLSPFLAQGVITMREIVLAMNRRVGSPDMASNAYRQERLISALRFFADRLSWRAGYFQNMESMPRLEFDNIHPGMTGLREEQFDAARFVQWKNGETGYPMVDAAMKMLHHTGWINMRLRGMVLSFAVNELWLHWREPALFLAREFVDYEPAIHYNQMQIHAGTAGAGSMLAYNPVKQAQELDPKGVFVRRWLPALQAVPDAYIFEPWTMSPAVQADCGVTIGSDYPAPLVDHLKAAREARSRVADAQVAAGIRQRAGSGSAGQKRSGSTQAGLF